MKRSHIVLLLPIIAACGGRTHVAPMRTQPPVVAETPSVHVYGESGTWLPDGLCGMLPDDGPCSMACRPDDLSDAHGVAGACIEFRCTAAGEASFRMDVCTPGQPASLRVE